MPSRQPTGYVCARCGRPLERDTEGLRAQSQPPSPAAPQAAVGVSKASQGRRASATAAGGSDFNLATDEAVESLAEQRESHLDQPWPNAPTANDTPGSTLIDWQFEDALRDVEATLRRRSISSAAVRRPLRLDSRQASAPAWRVAAPRSTDALSKSSNESSPPVSGRRDEPGATGGWLAWLVLWPGMTAFVCGSVLLGCSVVQQRDELWRVGLPLTLVGQGAVFFGGAMLVERLWSQRRGGGDAPSSQRELPEGDDPNDEPSPHRYRRASPLRRRGSSRKRRPTLSQSFEDDAGQLLDELRDRLDQLAHRL